MPAEAVPANLLPPEIVGHIAALCCQASQASLARVHSSYLKEAEQALYHTLNDPSARCLDALANTPWKLVYVRCLIVYFDCDERSMAFKQLEQLLIHMQSLKHLTIEGNRYKDQRPLFDNLDFLSWRKRLEDTLCDGEFPQLRTVHCDRYILEEVAKFIENHPKLRIFSADNVRPNERRLLKKMEGNFPRTIPVIYGSFVHVEDDCNRILHIFLHLYSPIRFPEILAIIGKVCSSRSLGHRRVRPFRRVAFYLPENSSPDIYQFINSLGAIFRRSGRELEMCLMFIFERWYQIPNEHFEDILTTFPRVDELKFSLRTGMLLDRMSTEPKVEYTKSARIAQVEAWGNLCPTLKEVGFVTGEVMRRVMTRGVLGHWLYLNHP